MPLPQLPPLLLLLLLLTLMTQRMRDGGQSCKYHQQRRDFTPCVGVGSRFHTASRLPSWD